MAKHTLFSECGRTVRCLERGSFYFARKMYRNVLKCTWKGGWESGRAEFGSWLVIRYNSKIKIRIQVRLDMGLSESGICMDAAALRQLHI